MKERLNFKSKVINFALHNRAGNWILRFIKYNLVGAITFLLGTVVFWLAFSTFGVWTWLIANCFGGFLEFSLINYVNKTRNGRMF
jgi:putative flippase GtrA